jgi:tetratricopeptide (TPR) repeat protein
VNTTLTKLNIRNQVAEFMLLVPTRNLPLIQERSVDLIKYLESKPEDNNKGLLCFVQGINGFIHNRFDEACTHFNKGIQLDLFDDDITGICHMGLGFTLRSLGNIDEAVSNIFRATELIDNNGDFKAFLNFCYHQLGEIHISINEHEMAIDYFNKSLNNKAEANDNMGLFRVHNGLGTCYQSMKQYDKGLHHLTKAIEFDDLSPAVISRGKNDLGVLYLETKEFAKAEKLLTESLEIREKIKLEDAACTSMMYLSEVYIEQQKIPQALELLNRCSTLIEKYHTKLKQLKLFMLLARAHSAYGNLAESIDYYQKYITLQTEVKTEQERKIFKLKNEQIEKQKKIISDKHSQLMATFDEIKKLKIDRRANLFSWVTVIGLVLLSEMFLDPLIENLAYDTLLSLVVKVFIALLFKPIDGMYERILWNKTLKKVG